MRIWILTMEDPLYTLDFIKDIIRERHSDIAGITLAEGGRMKIDNKRSKVVYVLSLFLIMGPFHFLKNVIKTVHFKTRKNFSGIFPFIQSPGLAAFAREYNIPVDFTDNPNSPDYLEKLRKVKPDIIINQSQFIIKKQLLEIPKIGMLNRHNALLPQNRGRLTSFWVLYKGEKETGVSIHFVDEGIDSGKIIVQKKISIEEGETFNSLVEKNYKVAIVAMLEALDLLEEGYSDFIENDDIQATYNSIPTLREALKYRFKKIGLNVE